MTLADDPLLGGVISAKAAFTLLLALLSVVFGAVGVLYARVAHRDSRPELRQYVADHFGFYVLLFLLTCIPAFLGGYQLLYVYWPQEATHTASCIAAGLMGVFAQLVILNLIFRWNLRRYAQQFEGGLGKLLNRE